MANLTLSAFGPMWGRFQAVFGWKMSDADAAAQMNSYFGALNDLPAEAVDRGITEAIRTEGKRPYPASVRNHALAAVGALRYTAGTGEPVSRLTTADGRPKCPTCGAIGPFEKALFDAEGNPRRWPESSPWAGEVMTRNTMDHDCEAYLPTRSITQRVPYTQGAA